MLMARIGNYEITAELGRGAMGVVYEAVQQTLGRKVALKTLAAEESSDIVLRFRREGSAYAQLSHQNILTIYDLIEDHDTIYLVTELIDGCDLKQLMQSGGPLPAADVATIGARIAEALDHAHFHELLHRDIKPANVMLSRHGAVKLTDFGVAKDSKAEDMTQTGMIVGSVPYLAPEVLITGEYSPRTDIWALGVMLYELLVGERPFIAGDDRSIASQILKATPIPLRKRLPTLPRRLAKAISRCLEKRPEKRWPDAFSLARELDRISLSLLAQAHPQEHLSGLMIVRGYEPASYAFKTIDIADEDAPPPKRRWWQVLNR